jgi:hypothetical protein
MMKAKGMAAGGVSTKTGDKKLADKEAAIRAAKGMKAGGSVMKKGYAAGGSMPMVTKDGKKVPAFAADGKGKMAAGGVATKGYAAGGKALFGFVKKPKKSR